MGCDCEGETLNKEIMIPNRLPSQLVLLILPQQVLFVKGLLAPFVLAVKHWREGLTFCYMVHANTLIGRPNGRTFKDSFHRWNCKMKVENEFFSGVFISHFNARGKVGTTLLPVRKRHIN